MQKTACRYAGQVSIAKKQTDKQTEKCFFISIRLANSAYLYANNKKEIKKYIHLFVLLPYVIILYY